MTSMNLDAHYSNNPKAQRSQKTIVCMPKELPPKYSHNTKSAVDKFRSYNHDIYIKSKKEEKRSFLNFMKYFCIGVGSVLLIKFARKIFKKS